MKKLLGIILVVLFTFGVYSCTSTETPTTETTEYIVTFDTSEGTAAESMIVNENSTITAPATTLHRYIITGWYTDADYNNEWNFNSDVVTDDMTLYAKWEKSEIIVNLAPSNIALTGAQYGGDINFPEISENLGSIATITNSGIDEISYRGSILEPAQTLGLTHKPLIEQTDPLYIYFNWDGSFGWIENYTGTVDTSRDINGQLQQGYNIKDYYNLDEYRVYVNYIRYRITTTTGEYLYYDGDALVDSADGSTFVLKDQYIEYNNNGTVEDVMDDTYNIAIERNNIDTTLAGYIENDPNASVEIIGVQLIAVYEEKLLEYWNDDDEAVTNSNIDMYTYYENNSGYTILTYMPLYATDNTTIPQQTLYDFTPANDTDPVPADYLAMFRTYFTIEGLDTNTNEIIELTQQKIEYAGGSDKPDIGVRLDEATGDVYYSIPVLANTTAVYEGEFEGDGSEPPYYMDFEFLIYVGLNNNGDYQANPSAIATITPTFEARYSVYDGYNGVQLDPVFMKFDIESNTYQDPIHVTSGEVSIQYNHMGTYPISDYLFSEKTDLFAIYSIKYNEPIINILTGESVKYPGTEEDIIINMEHSMNWIYQGSFPIELADGISKDDIFITEQYNYVYKSYKLDIMNSNVAEDSGYQDYIVGNNIHGVTGIEDSTPEDRRFTIGGFLEYYFVFDSASHWEERAMFPYTVLNSNNRKITFNNNNIVIPENTYMEYTRYFMGYDYQIYATPLKYYNYSELYILPGVFYRGYHQTQEGPNSFMVWPVWVQLFQHPIIDFSNSHGEYYYYLENSRNGNSLEFLELLGIELHTVT
jgi:uncharacterized repeat protein (TIGR02543 family)